MFNNVKNDFFLEPADERQPCRSKNFCEQWINVTLFFNVRIRRGSTGESNV